MSSEGNILIGFTKWLLKWIARVIGSLIALSLIATSGFYAWQWWTVGRFQSGIALVISNGNHCKDDKGHPIFVGFVNNTSQTVEYLRVRVRAYLPSRSPEILYYSEAVFDNLVKPKEGIGNCYSFTVSPAYESDKELPRAIYTGEITELRFWNGFQGSR